MDFNLESLRVGQAISCCVNKDGDLKYYVDGKDPGYLAWTGVPTDRPLWGFADIYGLARKIKSEFLCGEFACMFALVRLLCFCLVLFPSSPSLLTRSPFPFQMR